MGMVWDQTYLLSVLEKSVNHNINVYGLFRTHVQTYCVYFLLFYDGGGGGSGGEEETCIMHCKLRL
jgi:hypothetical protein